jgi:hypothetical protein
MDNKDRSFIAAQLSAGKSVEDAAEALVMRRAPAEVEKVANELAYSAQKQQWTREQQYYTLLGPAP